jgi:membrane protein
MCQIQQPTISARTYIVADFVAQENRMLAQAWTLLRDCVTGFIEDDALSRGAAMAFYAVTSLAPFLLIVVAIAGLAFGQEAAQNAIVGQLTGLMGHQSAELLQNVIRGAAGKSSGAIATTVGIVTLLITASGVFGEMQSALNAVWKTSAGGTTVSRLIRARAASLGLVAALGFLLMVSLVASAGISALGDVINAHLPFGALLLSVVNGVISFILISLLFAAIYKVLPDRHLEWRDVGMGALVTAAFFVIGKSLIGIYLGRSAAASTYGAAGALIIVLLWVYYSSEIFLFGAEFTKAYSLRHGSRQGSSVLEPKSNPPDERARQNRAMAPAQSEFPSMATFLAVAVVCLAFAQQWHVKRR